MQQREAPPSASRRAVIIGPNSPMADELEPLLQERLPGVPISRLRSYPSPRDLAGAMGSGGTMVDYVPCYRSEAGTGNAMGFVHWHA